MYHNYNYHLKILINIYNINNNDEIICLIGLACFDRVVSNFNLKLAEIRKNKSSMESANYSLNEIIYYFY